MRYLNVILFLLVATSSAFPQAATVQVNPSNKTISVSADHTITVEPEIALLRFGFRNTAAQKDEAYRENVKVAGEILKSLRDSGIKDEAISTVSVRLEREQQDEERPVKPEMLRYIAFQEWVVRVGAKDASIVVDLAMKAGVNDLSNPGWTVADPVGLEAKAYGTALAKAKKIAEQMALGLGAQLGDLVYATNSRILAYGSDSTRELPIVSSYLSMSARKTEPSLRLLPQRVERSVQVVATFAIK
jgi:uncharacterized protein YggE